MSHAPSHPHRRNFLTRVARAAALVASPIGARAALATPADARSLSFDHTHTGEHLDIVYAFGGNYVPQALTTLNHFLRDHYTGDIGVIDPHLFDLLHRIRSELGAGQPFQVISGYRCPATNATLKATRGGGVASHSLHMVGQAIDIRLPGVPLTDLRQAALSQHGGGVGYYQHDQFVHVDTGRVRHW